MYHWSRGGPMSATTTRTTASSRQPPPAEPAGDPPGDEENECPDRRVNQHQCQEVRPPRDRKVPSPHALTEADDAQQHDTRRGPAGQGTRDAPWCRASEDGGHN